MSTDEHYMLRCFELARQGIGSVSPNPRVGCVIVKDGKIIGEGWHKQYGSAHAEVNAINGVADKNQLTGSTVYVNLEPCSHFGKTPPCADLLITHKVGKVVIANTDTNTLVGGKGIAKLKAVGIEVVQGVLEREGRELNKRFFTFHERQRPYIILKWAQTLDGFIARANYESKWISHEQSRQLVHKWRSEEDAVLVGTKTAAHDNPLLTVRNWSGRNPVRLVIDRFLRLPDKLSLFDGSVKTICYNVLKHEEHANLMLVRLPENNFIESLLEHLVSIGLQSVMVEGGSTTLSLFLNAGLWDEARVFTSTRQFYTGIAAPAFTGSLVAEERIEADTLRVYSPEVLKPHH
ncbi:MAG: bifunctional diaminohydroxyphosphoribosylaminopyrimidine deaminase/5-amino-6-(5-phosphoribosylamino)uracil reductase RibD [Cyclobacteriaceae bacterium]|nr:bifunctional diaminohydroxyphosphoribosylaminopyrimidine deaminase/5-amino-6-(5-phosphoribosylamino)uracil reductase RibD [Cyclobacteriaceae bacterium]